MTTAATKYVGIDCHDATLVVDVIDGKGETVMVSTVPTRADAIRAALGGLGGALEIAFEEGVLAQWLYETLKPLGHRLVVCDPRKNRRQGNKNDRIDAHALAVRLRAGELSPVFHESGAVEALKMCAGVYAALVQDSVRVMQRIKSVYRSRAIRCRNKAVYTADTRGEWLERLPPAGRLRAELLGEELDHLRPLRQRAKTAMVAEARRHPAYRLLVSVPYIGPVRAAQLLATMITPWRFRTKRQLWAYAGLAVVTYSSADQTVVDGKVVRTHRRPMTRGLNRNHNRQLKEIFIAAAHDASTREGVCKMFYDQRVMQMGPDMARLTLARKIAAVTLVIWKKGVPFDPKRIAPTT